MSNQLFDLTFTPGIDDFNASRFGKPYTALVGPNNSGKSLVLKALKLRLGRIAYMAGPARFYHVYQLSTGIFDPAEIDQLENNFVSQYHQPQFNYEQNYLDLNKILINLIDVDRDKLFRECGDLIGMPMSLRRFDEANDLSMRYVDVGGRNLSVASTGTRLLMTLLGICLDTRFSTLLIDEPELGLSPRVQLALSKFLADGAKRREFAPHLQAVYVATHSHLFLDRQDISNNVMVRRSEEGVVLEPVSNMSELHRLQFNLLGNSLEDLFLPGALVVVEGPTDYDYLDQVLQLRFPDRRITVIPSQGDVKAKVYSLQQTLGDLQRSPFRSRLFVVVDSVHDRGLTDRLEQQGILRENVVVWDRNGIEYLYPAEIAAAEFNTSPDRWAGLELSEDVVTLNGISRRKKDLAALVIRGLTASTKLPEELEEKFLQPLAAAIE